jgi:hypothetical protein
MATAAKRETQVQLATLERWVASLCQLPGVEVIWLEGSLVDDRANPWSDIDLRLGITDDAYDQLWVNNRSAIMEGLGEYLYLWNEAFIRAVTGEGIIVELAARKVSELPAKELYEWKILFNRLPDGPHFTKLPERSIAESWPCPPVTVNDVRERTKLVIHYMANVPQDFHSGEVCAAAYTLNNLRDELFGIMYQRIGVRYGKRNKELSRIFPPDFIADLKSTYTQEGESALDLPALAAAQIRTFAALGKHLKALSDQLGGGFEPAWFARLFEKVTTDLSLFIPSGG